MVRRKIVYGELSHTSLKMKNYKAFFYMAQCTKTKIPFTSIPRGAKN